MAGSAAPMPSCPALLSPQHRTPPVPAIITQTSYQPTAAPTEDTMPLRVGDTEGVAGEGVKEAEDVLVRLAVLETDAEREELSEPLGADDPEGLGVGVKLVDGEQVGVGEKVPVFVAENDLVSDTVLDPVAELVERRREFAAEAS